MMPPSMARHPPPPRSHAPSPPTLRLVRADDEISVEVEGGFVRRRASADGVVIELGDRDVFVTADALVEALQALGRISATGK
jgi:hypothetical protein